MAEKILLVDDSAFNLKLMAALLDGQGYELLQARDGDSAVRLARQEAPDLILLDLVMPDKDGYQVCEELKGQEDTAEIPVIFLSGEDTAASKVRALDLGAADFMQKSFAREEIVARVRTQLRLRQLTKSLTDVNRELRARQEQIDADLRAAATIQRAMLPPARLSLPGLRLAWRFLPCSGVGGDIFDAFALDGDTVAFYMVDVSGHGVSSALLAVSAAHDIAALSDGAGPERRAMEPGELLAGLDRRYPVERFDKLLSACYATLDIRGGKLRYSSAGHPPPLLRRRGGELARLTSGGPLLGTGLDLPFEEDEVALAAGDRLLLYTDGVTEHSTPGGELFGEERLQRLCRELGDGDLEDLTGGIFAALEDFGEGAEPRDDVSLLAVEYAP